jgi:hypothetical protein
MVYWVGMAQGSIGGTLDAFAAMGSVGFTDATGLWLSGIPFDVT